MATGFSRPYRTASLKLKNRSADRRTDLARGVEKLKIDPSTC
jgi:hypothetical protein